MDQRGGLIFILFIVIAVIACVLYYAIKFSRRVAKKVDEQRIEPGTEMV